MDLITPSKLIKLRKNLSLSQSKLSEITNIKQFKISQFELNKLNLNKDEINLLQNILKDKLLVNNILRRKKRYQKHYYTGEIIKKTHFNKSPGLAFLCGTNSDKPESLPDAKSIASEIPNFIFLGSKLATTTTFNPFNSSGV